MTEREKRDTAKRRREQARERRRLVRLHLYESAAFGRGIEYIGGVDEVGRGPLAGPVVAACVVIREPLMLRGLNDSKAVLPHVREELAGLIKAQCVAWAIGEASVEEIERINIYWASVLAMERALGALAIAPHYLLTDAVRIKSFAGEQQPVIKGDAKCATVAAASIIAKIHRDRLLVELDALYPGYGFAEHKGYSTPQHQEALRSLGPCAIHRSAYAPVRVAAEAFANLELFAP